MTRTTTHLSAARLRRLPLRAMILLAAAQLSHAQGILGTNLIVNGNAEGGSASADGKALVSSIPGWTRVGNTNVLAYGLPSYLLLTSLAPMDHGFQYFFSGNTGAGASTLTQTIDVSSGASVISAGNVKYAASAYLGATSGGNTAKVVVAFQNAGGQTFTTATLGPEGYPVTPGTTLQTQIGLVPPGTSRVTVTVTFSGAYAAADNISLVFSALGTSPSSVLGANLIVNPGAEAGPSAPTSGFAPYVPGWSVEGPLSVAPYGGTQWIQLSDPGPADRGTNLFCKPIPGDVDMYQDIDVSPAASLIDSSQVTYQISAWLGNVSGTSPTLIYTFFDWSGNQLAATGQLGPLSRGTAGLMQVFHSGMLPSGTRRVRITLNFLAGTLDSLADNIAFDLAAPNSPPLITPGGVVSASAFGGFTSIAQGSWVEIYGANLASNTRGWAGSDFNNGVAPTSLDGVKVSIGGAPAFIDYISPAQVNALVPSNAPTGVQQLTVTYPNGTSEGFAIVVNATQPGLLAPPSFQVGGKQYLAAIFPDGSFALPQNAISGVASRPAKPGDTLLVYGIGFGPVSGGITAGTVVAQANSLNTPIQFLFGTTPATLSYDGLAPSFTGLYQFNIVVPNVPTNSAVPFSFTLGGAKGSQTLYIAVQD